MRGVDVRTYPPGSSKALLHPNIAVFLLEFSSRWYFWRVPWDPAWHGLLQALRSATEQRSGPSQAAWAGGSAGWWGGGPQTRWKAAGIGAVQSYVRSAAGNDRRLRIK